MSRLPSLSEIAAELRAKKSLGQNFLLNQGLCDHIAHALSSTADVLEIGPGPGGLTRALLQQEKNVTAVDFDPRIIQVLSSLQQVYPNNLTLLEDNALKLSLSRFPTPVCLVGNLPFNISTQLLLRWLPQSTHIAEMLLMFQAEVAERILAPAHSKSYGRLSVLAQYMMQMHIHCEVPSTAFTPMPKVNASVVHFLPQPDLSTRLELYPVVDSVLKICFSSRRKTLGKALKNKIPHHLALLEKADIRPELRAENLTPADFLRLANAVKAATV